MRIRVQPYVLRGGGWDDNVPSWARAAYRGRYVAANRLGSIGFRCVLRVC